MFLSKSYSMLLSQQNSHLGFWQSLEKGSTISKILQVRFSKYSMYSSWIIIHWMHSGSPTQNLTSTQSNFKIMLFKASTLHTWYFSSVHQPYTLSWDKDLPAECLPTSNFITFKRYNKTPPVLLTLPQPLLLLG